jgi:hypothetical protein
MVISNANPPEISNYIVIEKQVSPLQFTVKMIASPLFDTSGIIDAFIGNSKVASISIPILRDTTYSITAKDASGNTTNKLQDNGSYGPSSNNYITLHTFADTTEVTDATYTIDDLNVKDYCSIDANTNKMYLLKKIQTNTPVTISAIRENVNVAKITITLVVSDYYIMNADTYSVCETNDEIHLFLYKNGTDITDTSTFTASDLTYITISGSTITRNATSLPPGTESININIHDNVSGTDVGEINIIIYSTDAYYLQLYKSHDDRTPSSSLKQTSTDLNPSLFVQAKKSNDDIIPETQPTNPNDGDTFQSVTYALTYPSDAAKYVNFNSSTYSSDNVNGQKITLINPPADNINAVINSTIYIYE